MLSATSDVQPVAVTWIEVSKRNCWNLGGIIVLLVDWFLRDEAGDVVVFAEESQISPFRRGFRICDWVFV